MKQTKTKIQIKEWCGDPYNFHVSNICKSNKSWHNAYHCNLTKSQYNRLLDPRKVIFDGDEYDVIELYQIEPLLYLLRFGTIREA